MKPKGPYDTNLQMFIQPPCEVNLEKLRFLRWLAEQGHLEHEIAGDSSGPYAFQVDEYVEDLLSAAA